MDFLIKYNFSQEDIYNIESYISQNTIDNLNINKENVEGIVSYLIELGIEINAIKEIFMYQVGFFFKTKDEIKNSFDEYELDSIIKSLNYDVNNIELIDFI